MYRECIGDKQEKYLTTHHERDAETGLDYRGARFYDADVARFLSLDPDAKKYAEWSPYNYVFSNPIRLVDPTGRGPNNFGPPYWWEKGLSTFTANVSLNVVKFVNFLLVADKEGHGVRFTNKFNNGTNNSDRQGNGDGIPEDITPISASKAAKTGLPAGGPDTFVKGLEKGFKGAKEMLNLPEDNTNLTAFPSSSNESTTSYLSTSNDSSLEYRAKVFQDNKVIDSIPVIVKENQSRPATKTEEKIMIEKK